MNRINESLKPSNPIVCEPLMTDSIPVQHTNEKRGTAIYNEIKGESRKSLIYPIRNTWLVNF
ncbi:hypothetical protein DK846_00760 [Methanospirillum lacunae]|uniref:Uncharacterized protein n=1 Tax=Methanospirillum lacunae TaxID=668570 RepID=A0A2V2N7Q0_9EURY|nr:hypothetical protein DK846_00760 [Methanospirillum lacunae]